MQYTERQKTTDTAAYAYVKLKFKDQKFRIDKEDWNIVITSPVVIGILYSCNVNNINKKQIKERTKQNNILKKVSNKCIYI